MITYYKKLSAEGVVQQLPKYEKGSCVLVTEPSDKELIFLEENLELELGHLKDALDPFEVPRLEIEGSKYYVFTRYVVKRNETFKTFPLLLVMTNENLIMVTQQFNPFLPLLEANKLYNSTTQPLNLFIEVFMNLNAQFSQSINAINYQINKITYNVEEIENKDIIKLVNFENYLNDFLNIFVHNDTALQILLTRKDTVFKTENEYLEDLSLEIRQLLNRCKSSLKLTTNVRDAYSTILTNNLNQVVKFFTSVSVVLMIPTLIASYYGMNVPIPHSNHPLMFVVIISITIVVALVFLWLLVWKKII